MTCGPFWEIYDLSRRDGMFADKCVEQLALDPDAPDDPEYVAGALYQWIGKDKWWRTCIVPTVCLAGLSAFQAA